LGLIIASLTGSEGYSIWNNYISDLGSARYTSAPFIFDIIAIVSAILFVPILLYIRELFISKPEGNNKEFFYIRILGNAAFTAMIIGTIGFFGIGIFSMDRNYYRLHDYCSAILFVGFGIGALLSGIIILLKEETIFPKKASIIIIIAPPTSVIMFGLSPDQFTPQFLEWIVLFIFFIWLIPSGIYLIRHLNSKIISNNK